MNARAQRRSRTRHVVVAILLLTALFACQRSAAAIAGDPAIVRVVERWLTCEECRSGELDSVVARGTAATPILTAALNGPPDTVRAHFTQSTAAGYAVAHRQFLRLPPADQALRPLGDSVTLVRNTVQSFQFTYRLRAARALMVITPDSARALFRRRLVQDSAAGAVGSGSDRIFGPVLRHYLDSLVNSPP